VKGISKQLKAAKAELEVASMNLGDQIETEWIPFFGITYDPKDDLVEFVLEGLDHLIRSPKQIFVDEGADGLTSVEIVDSDDVKHIAVLKQALK
jgi:hypothetical protein